MREATLRDFFAGKLPAGTVAAEVRDAVEPQGKTGRRVYIEDLPAGEELTVTAGMLVKLCDAALEGSLSCSALEIIAFAIIASEHMRPDVDDELVTRVLYDWAVPDVNWELTDGSVRMFRDWLTRAALAPSEPDVTPDSLSAMGFLRRTSKVRITPRP